MEQGLQKNLDANDLVEMMFRFRTLLLNFIESCPIELIDKEYFTAIFDSIVTYLPEAKSENQMNSGSLESSLLSCTVRHGQIQLFVDT